MLHPTIFRLSISIPNNWRLPIIKSLKWLVNETVVNVVMPKKGKNSVYLEKHNETSISSSWGLPRMIDCCIKTYLELTIAKSPIQTPEGFVNRRQQCQQQYNFFQLGSKYPRPIKVQLGIKGVTFSILVRLSRWELWIHFSVKVSRFPYDRTNLYVGAFFWLQTNPRYWYRFQCAWGRSSGLRRCLR